MKIVFVGHSHISCIERASCKLEKEISDSTVFVQLRDNVFSKNNTANNFASPIFADVDHTKVAQSVTQASQGADLTVLSPNGNESFIKSLLNNPNEAAGKGSELPLAALSNYRAWLSALAHDVSSPAVVIPPPPPIESAAYILEHPGQFAEKLTQYGVAPAKMRLQAWLRHKRLIQQISADCGLQVLELPAAVFSENGFLNERFWGKDSCHANEAYGELLLRHLFEIAASPMFATKLAPDALPGAGSKSANKPNHKPDSEGGRHPYVGLPDSSFWKQAVAQVPPSQFDPVGEVPFVILRSDKVATAGSCFAQHISKRIRSDGFQFLITENPCGHESGDIEARGFYDFSARYGNIYTARQLIQLFDRAFGYFSPMDSHWQYSGDRFCDPFRPRIEPDGYSSVDALEEDRKRHLSAVREMFEQLDIFVYTLGLTECWVSRLDGAALPLAPGVAGGTFDTLKYEFVNFEVGDVVSDMQLFIRKLRLVNPKAKLILTVSPVPLAATYEPNNVLVSTAYSKSVLRVAADIVSRSCENVYYFPSFEIISGNYNRGRYFGPDLRSVTEEGVDHVMSVFMRHMTEGGAALPSNMASVPEDDKNTQEMMVLAEAACDEELLERK